MAMRRTDDENENDFSQSPKLNTRKKQALSQDLFHGLTPEEFDHEAKRLAELEALTPKVRARMKAQLVERLKTPVDEPSWGPDWVRHGERVSAQSQKKRNAFGKLFARKDDEVEDQPDHPLSEDERDDSQIITRNMEKSRQVAHYRPLYAVAVALALGIAVLAMFVDYSIIRGDVWTRALSNEFMVVPASLQTSVIFKSMQVLFAVLIIHFMLKITGAYGRNTLITTGFVLALMMVGCLGYLVAYNNLDGATSARYEQHDDSGQPQTNSIDKLFSADAQSDAAHATDASTRQAEYSLPLPKLSQTSLANAAPWIWFGFAAGIFFIVAIVAALFMQVVENNVRNFHIAHDFKHRRKQFTQLHLLELADRRA
jgi:hypothetical protein